MKPIDDNENPDDISDEIDEVTDDIEVDFDLEAEIKRKSRSRGKRRKTSGKEYGTIIRSGLEPSSSACPILFADFQ